MSILKHYVVTETLKIFFVTIILAMLILTLGGGVREGIRQGLPLPLMVRTMPLVVPEMLLYTIPGGLLFAVCSVFGRMTATNELVAIKSLGINPLCLVWPVLTVAYLLSVVTFGLYDVCAVWSRPGLARLVTASVDRIALGFLRTHGSFTTSGLSIVVKGVEQDRLLQPVISVEARGAAPPLTLTAREARLEANPLTGALRVACRDGTVEVDGRGSFRFPDWEVREIMLREPDSSPEDSLTPSNLASRVIPRQIRREKALLADLDGQLAATDADESAERDRLREQLRSHRNRLARLQAEVPRRLSNGFGCLCFALIGIPVAMWGRSADTMSVFFLCFVPILLLYYPLLVVGENLARGGTVPHLSVWLADAVLLAIGAMLLVCRLRR